MICPFRVQLKKERIVNNEITTPIYMPCYESECPLYYVKGFDGGTGCKRVDRELERED